MFNNLLERKGPAFNETVTVRLDPAGSMVEGRVIGNLGRGQAKLVAGDRNIRGTLAYVSSEEAGRPTRTLVFSYRGQRILVGEEGLSAGKTGIAG
jgi:hypothetical protein